LAAALALTIALTGCTGGKQEAKTRLSTVASPSPSLTSAPIGAPVNWKPCPGLPKEYIGQNVKGFTFDCGAIKVPEDWNNPDNGKTFDIALARARAGNQNDRIGSLLMDPGGPGGSGLELVAGIAGQMPPEITQRFDLVGFDPRGVGKSSPVKCITPTDQDALFAADPDPRTQAQFDAVVALNQKVDNACVQKYGNQLPLFSTEQAARDMDDIREAIGDKKLTYLGFSYGTLLGAVYAQIFPKNLRAMVLDGAVDPKQGFVAGSLSQAQGFETAFNDFAKWCKSNTNQCPIADDPEGEVMAALKSARANPLTGSDGRKATPGMLITAIASAMYTQQYWQPLAQTIALLKEGNPRGVFILADAYSQRKPDGTYTNMFDAFNTVSCSDTNEKPTLADIRADQASWREKYPLFGASMAMGMLTCALWPGQRDPYPTGKAEGAPPILVVGTTGDPATPYGQTRKLADMLGVGEVLTWDGEGHTAYPQTTCISNAVDDYLINLKTPPSNTVCPAK
jgi:pimeloyl-ACP methyl ester carboxylesterase